jgi:hypothetical protein
MNTHLTGMVARTAPTVKNCHTAVGVGLASPPESSHFFILESRGEPMPIDKAKLNLERRKR